MASCRGSSPLVATSALPLASREPAVPFESECRPLLGLSHEPRCSQLMSHEPRLLGAPVEARAAVSRAWRAVSASLAEFSAAHL